MREWWAGMAPRERLLIAIAGGLIAIIVIWQFVFIPTMTARDEARAALNDANRVLAQVQEDYMRKRAIGSAQASTARPRAASIEAFKAAITGSASDVGLSIARLQGTDTSNVRLVFDNADPRLIFVWLEDVQAKQSAQIARFNMEQAGGGLVRVTVDLIAGGV